MQFSDQIKILHLISNQASIGFKNLLEILKTGEIIEKDLLDVGWEVLLSKSLQQLKNLILIEEIAGPISLLNSYYITADGLETLRKHKPCLCKLCQLQGEEPPEPSFTVDQILTLFKANIFEDTFKEAYNPFNPNSDPTCDQCLNPLLKGIHTCQDKRGQG